MILKKKKEEVWNEEKNRFKNQKKLFEVHLQRRNFELYTKLILTFAGGTGDDLVHFLHSRRVLVPFKWGHVLSGSSGGVV